MYAEQKIKEKMKAYTQKYKKRKENCHKISVNTPCVYIRINNKFDGPSFRKAYIRGVYIWEEKHFNLRPVKLTFLSFYQYKIRISSFFASCNM